MTANTPKFREEFAGSRQVSRVGQEAIVFKGSKQGISILIDEGAQISEIISELRKKLQPAPGFFAGAAVRVDTGRRELQPQERDLLVQTVAEFGLVLSEGVEEATDTSSSEVPQEKRTGEAVAGHPAATAASREAPPNERALIVRRTLRSGQRVDHDGHVVVLGDVNPGAVVTCTGDILVLGSLRGVAHAGAGGNVGAMVMAFRLEPTQLRIAHYISRAPDEALPHPAGPEVAVVKEDMIQIDAYVP